METLEFKVVTVDEAREELEATRKRGVQIAQGPAESRAEGDRLLDATVRWLAGLPEDSRPIELARNCPRVANALAQLWQRVPRCEEYLDSLVVDDRGGRKGFPFDVAMELTRLRRYYAALHPVATPSTAIDRAR